MTHPAQESLRLFVRFPLNNLARTPRSESAEELVKGLGSGFRFRCPVRRTTTYLSSSLWPYGHDPLPVRLSICICRKEGPGKECRQMPHPN